MAVIPLDAASQTTAPGQQAAEQSCEQIKQEIKDLQDALVVLTADLNAAQKSLDSVSQSMQNVQGNIKKWSSGFGFEAQVGRMLDALQKIMDVRRKLKNEIEDLQNLILLTKERINDLLNALANCGPPSTTVPSKEETPNPQPPPPKPEENKKVSFQLRGFGGATIINSNAPSTAGFDGAVLFPLGNRVLVGPTLGFQWVNSSIVSTIGGGPPPSTFINTSVGFKEGNFGGQVGFDLRGWELGIRGGATVAGSAITQNEGFCDPTAGCMISSATTTHDTVVGPFVGGYISHSIFSHVGVFAEFDYHRLKDNNVLDVSDRSVVGGLVLSFGRHGAK